LLLYTVVWPWANKSSQLRHLEAELRFIPLEYGNWPIHDTKTVAEFTGQFEDLGFHLVSEGVWKIQLEKAGSNHERCLVHDGHQCLATVNLPVYWDGSIGCLSCSIETLFGTEGNLRAEKSNVAPPIALPEATSVPVPPKLSGYAYFTQNTKPPYSLGASLLAHPNLLATAVPGATPAQLLDLHLQRRAEITHLAGLQPDGGDLLSLHHALHLRFWSDLPAQVRRKNPWLTWATGIWKYRTQNEWLGDFAEKR
jgi:hypothetical protein